MNYKMLVVGHNGWPDGVNNALNYVCGFEKIDTITLSDEFEFEAVENAILNYLKTNNQTLIVTDLIGGSPHQTAVKIILENNFKDCYVLAGGSMSLIMNCGFKVFLNENLTANELKTFLTTELQNLNKYTMLYIKE